LHCGVFLCVFNQCVCVLGAAWLVKNSA
jgi:hypothetical protein